MQEPERSHLEIDATAEPAASGRGHPGMALRCPGCGWGNPERARFCGHCGIAFGAAPCSRCAALSAYSSRYCQACGAPRSASDGLSSPAQFPTEDLGTTRFSPGERRDITVLFADVCGSLELLSGRDPEDASRILDPVIEQMMEAVHQQRGVVNQVLGDGIMALFGAPPSLEDHALRGCRAAQHMLASVSGPAALAQPPLRIRVGLSSGQALIHRVTNDLRTDLAAMGRVVSVASVLERLARPGTAVVAAETGRLVSGRLSLRPLGPVSLPGLRATQDVFEMVAPAASVLGPRAFDTTGGGS